jgi:hypothetical protein
MSANESLSSTSRNDFASPLTPAVKIGVTNTTASASTTAAIAAESAGAAKPVSIASVISCASGRSSTCTTCAGVPSATSDATAASPRRSASRRVELGSESPAETTAMVVMMLPDFRCVCMNIASNRVTVTTIPAVEQRADRSRLPACRLRSGHEVSSGTVVADES